MVYHKYLDELLMFLERLELYPPRLELYGLDLELYPPRLELYGLYKDRVTSGELNPPTPRLNLAGFTLRVAEQLATPEAFVIVIL